jgi:hypothetical protein
MGPEALRVRSEGDRPNSGLGLRPQNPTSRENRARYPEFPVRSTGHDRVCAFLFKERRMKFAGANKPHRKSGMWGTVWSAARRESNAADGNSVTAGRGVSWSAVEEEDGSPAIVHHQLLALPACRRRLSGFEYVYELSGTLW